MAMNNTLGGVSARNGVAKTAVIPKTTRPSAERNAWDDHRNTKRQLRWDAMLSILNHIRAAGKATQTVNELSFCSPGMYAWVKIHCRIGICQLLQGLKPRSRIERKSSRRFFPRRKRLGYVNDAKKSAAV